MQTRPTATVILYKDDKILLQHRSPDAVRNPNFWGCFGGGIEEGETPEQAIKREMLEELEYTLRNPRHIDTETTERGNLKVTMYTFVEEYDGSPLVLHEGQGYGWFTLDEALKLQITPERRALLEKLRNKIFT